MLFHLAVPSDMDVPEEDYGYSYSFVTSKADPTKGYFLPSGKRYIYKVGCEDTSTCKMEKIYTGYKNPWDPVTMSPDDGLTC